MARPVESTKTTAQTPSSHWPFEGIMPSHTAPCPARVVMVVDSDMRTPIGNGQVPDWLGLAMATTRTDDSYRNARPCCIRQALTGGGPGGRVVVVVVVGRVLGRWDLATV